MSTLLTATQAAERLGVGPRRVLTLIHAGRLPASRFGHIWMVKAEDLALVAERPKGWPKGRPRK